MSVLLERLAKDGSVPLERYGYQVGGHYLMFQYEDTICKPVIPREHFFYQTTPELLKRYVPGYYGLIIVRYEKLPSGKIEAVASPRIQPVLALPPSLLQATPTPDSAANMAKPPKCTTGLTIHSKDVVTSDTVNGEAYKNPWATMCNFNMDERLKELGGDLDSYKKDYMILENLTSNFKSPCVLDLKVGTRQHGDGVTVHKMQKHMYTVSISTSSSMGVRMAGMQKYDALNKKYIFYDKYFGKYLSEKEFGQIVRFFLTNGICFRSDLVPRLIRMLEDLCTAIKSQRTFRYFSSSLLILYDGAKCPEGLGLASGADSASQEPDFDDILRRVNAAGREKKNIDYSAFDVATGSSTTSTPTNHRDSGGATPLSDATPHMTNGETASPLTPEELAEIRQHVDVRMIDFAHSTHAGYQDPVKYEGVDEGYLFGLQSLISVFKSFTNCENGCK